MWALRAGSREWFQLGVSQHQHWKPPVSRDTACPTKPQLILWGAWASTPAPLAFSERPCNGRRILCWTKSCFQVMFGHIVIIPLCISHCKTRSAIRKPSGPVAIPGLRSSWRLGPWLPAVSKVNSTSTPVYTTLSAVPGAGTCSSSAAAKPLTLWNRSPKHTKFNHKTCLGSCWKGETSCLHMHSPEWPILCGLQDAS